MNPSKFKKAYFNVLHKDQDTEQYYFKTKVENLYELGYLQKGLLTSLFFLSQLPDEYHTKEELKNCFYWISKILVENYPDGELEGIDVLLDQ